MFSPRNIFQKHKENRKGGGGFQKRVGDDHINHLCRITKGLVRLVYESVQHSTSIGVNLPVH